MDIQGFPDLALTIGHFRNEDQPESRAIVMASVYRKEDKTDRVAQVTLGLPNSEEPYVSLYSFYVFPRRDKEEGWTKYKGLGKAMLCAVMRSLKLEETTEVRLIAVPTNDDEEEEEEKTRTLIAYYKTYGFKVDEAKQKEDEQAKEGAATMIGTIGGILTACGSGGRRKRRRTLRRQRNRSSR